MSENRTSNWNSNDIVDWLLRDGKLLPGLEDMILQLGEKLLLLNVPVNRIRLSMRTLHPLITAYSAIWERGAKTVETRQAPHGLDQRPARIGSPMQIIGETRKPFRKDLVAPLAADEHSSLHELKERGATDYYGVPLEYTGRLGGILVFTSDHEDGFSDHDISQLDRVALALSPIAELSNSNATSQSIANAYLGPRTGELVLDGKITRGDIETIEAAILVSDLRDWTGISNRLAPKDALALVNSYFETLASAIERYDGEILKFVGDGILAIFAVDGKTPPRLACQNALMAATSALEEAKSANFLADRKFGQGLHFGQVLYGNIGSEARLDFTVLGEAVNRTARIEGLSKELGRSIVMSEEFAQHLEKMPNLVASCPLKGFEGNFNIFAVE